MKKQTTKLFAMVALFATVLFASCKKEVTPVADFSYTFDYSTKVDTFGYIDTVSFTNLSTDADTYLWSFGNGRTSTEKNPRRDFDDFDNAEFVTFTISLTATKDGKSSTKTKNIVGNFPR